MIVNNFEFFLMNNWFRRLSQKLFEIKTLRKISDLSKDKIVLEIGCGSGYGTKLINQYFSPQKIYAIDLDEKMIKLAQKNNQQKNVIFKQSNILKTKFFSNKFNAVFNFGALHHIKDWQGAIMEIKRILKLKGQLIAVDFSRETFKSPIGRIFKKVTKHPYKSMYEYNSLLGYLKDLGFKIKVYKYNFLNLLPFFVLCAIKDKPLSKNKI